MEKKRSNAPILIFKLLLSLICFWLIGFVVFVTDVFIYTPPLHKAGGIVVLTGGTGRVDAAINLLGANYGEFLLISGVRSKTTLANLESYLPHKISPLIRNKITLGYNATSTLGNAFETASWANEHHLNSLIVVTSNYHMRRALIELKSQLNAITLYPYVIRNDKSNNFFKFIFIRTLFIEYNKFLMAYVGLIHTVH